MRACITPETATLVNAMAVRKCPEALTPTRTPINKRLHPSLPNPLHTQGPRIRNVTRIISHFVCRIIDVMNVRGTSYIILEDTINGVPGQKAPFTVQRYLCQFAVEGRVLVLGQVQVRLSVCTSGSVDMR